MEFDHNGCESLTSKQEIFNFMLNFTKRLRSDCDFASVIEIRHKDYSRFILNDAHLEEDEKKIYVYTEHCGFFWFFKDDLEEMRESTLSWDGKEEPKYLLDRITVFDLQ